MNCVTGERRNITIEGDATKRLADPDLIARWAELRTRLAYRSDPDWEDIKLEYDAVVMEYRRRLG